MATDNWHRMSQLELASGMVFGDNPETPPLPDAPPGLTARAPLENVMLALRPP